MKWILTGAAVLAAASLSQAQILGTDDFSYTGALTSNGWTAHSGGGNKVIMADGSVATLDQSGGSGEDINLAFTAQGATDKTYASFDLRVPSGNAVNPDASGLYFAHFKDSGFAFRARTGLLSPAGAGDFLIAINGDNSNLGAGAAWGSDGSFDTTYQVVISWDAATGEGELWVDPTSETSTSVTHTGTNTGTLIEGFALRQSNDYTGFIEIDNVVVGTTFGHVVFPAGPGPEIYCTAGSSASGCQAMLSTDDWVASATAPSGFTVTATGVEGGSNGLFYFSATGKFVAPWGLTSSFMCVASPRYRTPILQGSGGSGTCDGVMTRDLNAMWCPSCPLPAKNFGAGTVYNLQFFYRDPFSGVPGAAGKTGLSNAMEFIMVP